MRSTRRHESPADATRPTGPNTPAPDDRPRSRSGYSPLEEGNVTQNATDDRPTRRAFLGGTAALAASAVVPRGARGGDAGKPNSVFNGVRIGCITYMTLPLNRVRHRQEN